jgi:Ni/Fe-hydrogenase subunit HybB-like protein
VIVMQTPLSRSLPSTPLKSPLFVFQVLVMGLSVAIGRVAAKRFSNKRR